MPTRTIRYVPPNAAWRVPSALDEEPAFAPTVHPRVRPSPENERVMPRLRAEGLPAWATPGQRATHRHSGRAGAIGCGGKRGQSQPPAREPRAWRSLATRAAIDPAASLEPLVGSALLAEQGKQLLAVDFANLIDGFAQLYVTGDQSTWPPDW
jgi:hypothetical protein